MKILSVAAVLLSASMTVYADGYQNTIPGASQSSMYYAMGGGNTVPAAPSTANVQTVSIGGAMGLGYNCGTFNPSASITNSLNGLKNSFTNMFDNAVQNAKGAVMEMPAYLIARNNPGLYQLLQNGFQSGQFGLGFATKSCTQMQNEIASGQNPYKNFFSGSIQNDWKDHMGGSSSYSRDGLMSYQGAEDSDIGKAKEDIEQDNGKNGVPWTNGIDKDGNHYAGGEDQPVIKLTYDVVIAGVNAILGETDYHADINIPQDQAMSAYWHKSSQVATWAEKVLGEKVITTFNGGQKTASPGTGLLPFVQQQFKGIYPLIITMLGTPDADIQVKDLKKISTSSVILNLSVIDTLRHSAGVAQNIEVNSLAEGVASAKVVDQAQMLIQILQSAEQVPAIANNDSAQSQIKKYIATLKTQIDRVVSFKSTNQKLITNNIEQIISYQAKARAAANQNRPEDQASMPQGGVVKTKQSH